jgi:hypothetical protein
MDKPENPPAFPSKAEFSVAPFDDGSGHHTTVGYNSTHDEHWRGYIHIGGNYNVTVPVEYADELIAAIRFCADALLAARGEA